MRKQFSTEMKAQTAAYILESGKTYKEVADEIGVDSGTIYKWMKKYKEKHGIIQPVGNIKQPATNEELLLRIRNLEQQLKEKNKELEKQKKQLEYEKENVEILKKSLHILAGPRE